jgi:Pyruvate/2-oxoacid:ferredoxin oxidoreductase gamma subunit
MSGSTLTIRIGGEPGDGVIRCGEILAAALARARHAVLFHRGRSRVPRAPESALLRTADRPLLSVGDSLDILFAWSQEAYDRYRDTLWPEGLLLYDPDRVRARDSDAPIRHGVALTRLAARFAAPEPKAHLAAGVAARLLGIPRDAFAPASAAEVAAFDAGHEVARRPPLGVVRYELDVWSGAPGKLQSGAAAAARALAVAGARTAICAGAARDAELVRALASEGIEVAAENDEAAALARAREAARSAPALLLSPRGLAGLGAILDATAGAPVVAVQTPAVGALGDEGDLVAMLERRAADLLFVPANARECRAHARRAAETAARHRAPVALYVDPVLEDLEETLPESSLYPAGGAHRNLEEAGRAAAREWAEVHFPAGTSVGVVSWGATHGAIREARLALEAEGIHLAHFQPRVLLPIPDDALRRFLEPLARIVAVEPEPAGPLAAVLRDRFGVAVERIDWPSGVPLTPEAVRAAVVARA